MDIKELSHRFQVPLFRGGRFPSNGQHVRFGSNLTDLALFVFPM